MTATRFVKLIPALLTLLLLNHVKVAAQEKDSDYQWQENILDDGIAVYTRKVQGSRHKAVRAEMTIHHWNNKVVLMPVGNGQVKVVSEAHPSVFMGDFVD